MSEVCYSHDGETYHADLESACDGNFFISGVYEIYEGESVKPKVSELLSGGHIVDIIKENAYDNYDEWSEGYLDDMSKEDEVSLEKHIEEWFDKKGFLPTFYKVYNTKKVKVKVAFDECGCEDYELIENAPEDLEEAQKQQPTDQSE